MGSDFITLVLFHFVIICNFRHSHEHDYEIIEDADFYEYFKEGVKAYNLHEWSTCQSYMVQAIVTYHQWEKVVTDCHRKCASLEKLSNETQVETELLYLDKMLRTTSCVISCKKTRLKASELPDLSEADLTPFETWEPYNYLQLCAFRVDSIEQAVAAAYTYFLQNPGHDVMKQNLIDYRALPGVTDSFFKDVERPTHSSLYIHGLSAFHEEVWLLVIDYMIRASQTFFIALENCEFMCEEKNPVTKHPTSILENHINVLRCKQQCETKLSRYHDKFVDNMVADFHHYLQFAFYHVKDIKRACESVANYLLLKPDDKVMQSNKLYYLKWKGAKEEDFTPSPDILKFHKHKTQIAKILTDYEDSKTTSRVYEVPSSAQGPPYQPSQVADDNRDTSAVVEEYKKRGISVTYTEADLNGPQRVVADGFATEETCNDLIRLANLGTLNDGYNVEHGRQSPHTVHEKFVGLTVAGSQKIAGQQGDGYHNTRISTPHTKHEMFEGMTIARGVHLVMTSKIAPEVVQQYLDVTKLSREFTKKYFGLENLYFDFTHLVCRTSLDKDKTREDLSHPIHADNCIIQKDGSCKRDLPAYIERDFSALLYLNDDFEGGDFFFTHKNLSASATVRPKCGRVVAFNATNYHGVKAVLSGHRCAVAIWYTLDKRYQEVSHQQAASYLNALRKEKEEAAASEAQGPPVESTLGQRSDSESHDTGSSETSQGDGSSDDKSEKNEKEEL